VLGVDGWVQGNASRAVLQLTRHHAAFTTKIAAWPTAQASRDGRRRPLVTLPNVNETELIARRASVFGFISQKL